MKNFYKNKRRDRGKTLSQLDNNIIKPNKKSD